MLEKIGLPAKPSAKGRTWVIDASSCQTCQGFFTMFNRKHHCRRCGGIFCGNCTSQRAVLRGQGDAPVRICDPCKKLEEAARFQLRNRGNKGAKAASVAEDDSLLKEALGDDVHTLLSGRHEGDDEIDDHHSNRAISKSGHSSKNSSAHVSPSKDGTDDPHHEESHFTPEELRNQAIEQKTLYTSLKREGKHAEALQAYKRSKELGREADALELSLKKIQRKATLEASQKLKESPESAKDKGHDGTSEAKGKDVSQDLKRGRLSSRDSGDDDLLKTLKDLGWDDADLVEKKPKKGPSSDLDLLAEISDVLPKEAKKPAKETPTQLEILAHKRKALALKREGKPAEAKEELKKAKLLEKKLEEMAIFGDEDEEDADDDDDLAKLMKSLEKEAKLDLGKGNSGKAPADFSLPSFLADDDDAHIDVTDDDIHDPSMVAALREMGWEEEAAAMERSRHPSTSGPEALHIAASVATESQLQSEILATKRQALALKREGKTAEAKVKLQEAKTLEQQLEVLRKQPPVPAVRAPGRRSIKDATQMKLEDILEDQDNPVEVDEEDEKDPEILAALKAMGYVEDEVAPPVQTYIKPSPQEKKNLQDEILAVKRSALALKKSGRIAEAKEELRQAKALEQKLERLTAELEADGLHKPITVGTSKWGKPTQLSALPLSQTGFVSEDEEEEVEVSAEDFMDPELVAALKSVGWQEEDTFVQDKEPEKVEEPDSPPAPVQPYKPVKYTAKGHQRKLQLQKDLLSHKRRALTLKREGKVEEAKAELKLAKAVEKEMEEIENAASGTVEVYDEGLLQKSRANTASLPAAIADEYEEDEEVTDADMQDPEMLDALKAFGWKPEPEAPVVNNHSKSSSSALPALARLDNTVSLKTVIDSGRMPEATPQVVGLFDTSRIGSKKYENPPYTKEPTPDAVSDPIWQSILNSSSRKQNDDFGKSDSHVKELQQGTSFKTSSGLAGNLSAPFFDHPTPDTNDTLKASRQGSLDLLSGETWSSPTKQDPVESDSDEDEDLFDPDMLAALQSIGMAPPSMNKGKKPQAEAAVAKQASNSRMSVKGETAPAKDDRGESAGSFLPVLEPKVERVASGRSSISGPVGVSEARAETAGPAAVPAPPKSETSDLQEEIKMRKRKAVAFKREGKMAEAREELKQAKLLEKQLEMETQAAVPDESLKSASAPVVQNQPPPRIHYEIPPPAAAPVVTQTHKQQMQQQVRQGKDRMKLQRESLAHKRKALGLRREGKIEEADAEFELAKQLEKQMDDLDPSKPAHDEGDMGLVEDLLDPQLMAALKGIRWNDGDLYGVGNAPKPASSAPSIPRTTQPSLLDITASRQASSSSAHEVRANTTNQPPARKAAVSTPSTNPSLEDRTSSISQPPARRAPQAPESQETKRVNEGGSARPSASRAQEERKPLGSVGEARTYSVKSQEERKKLEDRIKQEKVRAVGLKRAGRTGEALDVLRGAKQLEKQLQSMS